GSGELRRELSLDQPDSALSRFVAKMEAGLANLTLDDDHSARSRLTRDLKGRVEERALKSQAFHVEVRATLAALKAQREEAARSTRHGVTFESELGALLTAEAQRVGDVCEATGARPGLKGRKHGDHVVTLGPESAAPEARIVFEAKDDVSYDLKRGLAGVGGGAEG